MGLGIPSALAALVLGGIGTLYRTGFAGISDDDAARALIAWESRLRRSLDPTQSSWLPVPSWIASAVLRAWPDPWLAPRVLSALALAASAAFAARLALRAGARPWSVLAIGGVLATWTWTRACGASSGMSEAFATLGLLLCVASFEPDARNARVQLALGVVLAAGSRYEAFAAIAALGLSHLAGTDAARRRHARAALGLLGMAAVFWLFVNARRSGDPWDFVQRVRSYRAAHEALGPWTDRLTRHPRTALVGVPGLCVLVVAGFPRILRACTFRGGVAAALGLLVFLTASDAGGGGATHHVGRALLAFGWLLAAPAAWVLTGASKPVQACALAACVLQVARPAESIPRAIDPATLAVAHTLRSRTILCARAWVASSRSDRLWPHLSLAAHASVLEDRAFESPRAERSLHDVSQIPECVVSSDPEVDVEARARGLRPQLRAGPWQVWTL